MNSSIGIQKATILNSLRDREITLRGKLERKRGKAIEKNPNFLEGSPARGRDSPRFLAWRSIIRKPYPTHAETVGSMMMRARLVINSPFALGLPQNQHMLRKEKLGARGPLGLQEDFPGAQSCAHVLSYGAVCYTSGPTQPKATGAIWAKPSFGRRKKRFMSSQPALSYPKKQTQALALSLVHSNCPMNKADRSRLPF